MERKERHMLTTSLILTTVLAAQAPAAAAQAPATAAQAPSAAPSDEAYVGRWNVKLTDTEDTFAGAGFQIDRSPSGLTAAIVWRWGSFAPVKSVEVKQGVLRMVREDEPGKPELFEARLEGGSLRGQVRYADGKLHHFEGKPAPELAATGSPVWGAPVSLFDGKTLTGWRLRDPKAQMGWAVVNGELAVVEPKGNADLVSERAFQDQKLHLEFNVEPHSNSGVYLRGRYEIQILDNPDAKMARDTHGCGAIYSRIAPSAIATKPAGEWQTLDATMVGRRVTVVLNGVLIVDGVVLGITGGAIDPFEDHPGPLMLQGDHGKVRFRNVVVTPAQ
jgi:hypothetical protein